MVLSVHHLVGSAEIARMLNVSRQRADALSRRDDFPAPVAHLKTGRVWESEAVEVWARSHGREIHDWSGTEDADDDGSPTT